jgi:hypothetical protein
MARAGEGFGAGKLLSPNVDFRLIEEFDPVVLQRLVETDPRRDRRRIAELPLQTLMLPRADRRTRTPTPVR